MKSQGSKGFTLLDTMIVVSIMATFAVMALPSFTSNDTYQLDLAKNEIVAAIRFARSEALRTGETYGVDINRASKQITIYKADLTVIPVGQEFIAYHPINKNPYDYNLNTDFNLINVSIVNSTEPFLFTDSVRRKSLLFDANGTPVWFDSNTGTTYQLNNGVVELAKGVHTYNVSVQPYNGRVTSQ
ncbi:MAG: hypothetical protein GKR92_01875 [Gammaproteobacteria bacterium]|nr:MAG: hypothetical protein GKR92_01875 [Gammaproteobacteria bacterium]